MPSSGAASSISSSRSPRAKPPRNADSSPFGFERPENLDYVVIPAGTSEPAARDGVRASAGLHPPMTATNPFDAQAILDGIRQWVEIETPTEAPEQVNRLATLVA